MIGVVRIKRKREEPAIPSLLLGDRAKRPSFAGLSLGGDTPAGDAPVAPNLAGASSKQRYRLVSSVPARPGEAAPRNAALGMPSAVAASRVQQLAATQAAARFRLVALRRAEGGAADGAMVDVLELQRCSAPVPKIVPFGTPLPPTADAQAASAAWVPPSPSPFPSMLGDEDDAMEQIWRDAAAAAQLSPPRSDAGLHAGEAEFVYDEYVVDDGRADGEGEGGAAVGALEGEAIIWWDEIEEDGLIGEDERYSEGSDSQGEQDYPEDESSDGAGDDGGERF